MKKLLLRLLLLLAVLVVAALGWWWYIQANSDALWKIVNQKCVPGQQQRHDPVPCLAADLTRHFVVFKDAKGPLHTLVLPTEKISGIEDPQILAPDAPNFFYHAWQERARLGKVEGKALSDRYLGLAVNSRYGRTQNQLHVHLACLRPAVIQVLTRQAAHLGAGWQPLGEALEGHHYLAMKIPAARFEQENPFVLLNRYVQQRGDKMAKYGLAVAMTGQSEFLLLANRLEMTDFNLGSAGEILDYGCTIGHASP